MHAADLGVAAAAVGGDAQVAMLASEPVVQQKGNDGGSTAVVYDEDDVGDLSQLPSVDDLEVAAAAAEAALDISWLQPAKSQPPSSSSDEESSSSEDESEDGDTNDEAIDGGSRPQHNASAVEGDQPPQPTTTAHADADAVSKQHQTAITSEHADDVMQLDAPATPTIDTASAAAANQHVDNLNVDHSAEASVINGLQCSDAVRDSHAAAVDTESMHAQMSQPSHDAQQLPDSTPASTTSTHQQVLEPQAAASAQVNKLLQGNGAAASSSATSSSDDDSDLESIDYDEMRTLIAKMEASDDDGEHERDVAMTSSMPDAPPLDVVIDEHDVIQPAGGITGIVDGMIVIQGLENSRALDEGSIVCLSDRTPVGRIEEVFGPVMLPMYALRYAGPQPMPDTVRAGERVFSVEKFTSFVAPDKLYSKDVRVEELQEGEEDEVAFSDDEKEAEFLRSCAVLPPSGMQHPCSAVPCRGGARGRGGRGRGGRSAGYAAQHAGAVQHAGGVQSASPRQHVRARRRNANNISGSGVSNGAASPAGGPPQSPLQAHAAATQLSTLKMQSSPPPFRPSPPTSSHSPNWHMPSPPRPSPPQHHRMQAPHMMPRAPMPQPPPYNHHGGPGNWAASAPMHGATFAAPFQQPYPPAQQPSWRPPPPFPGAMMRPPAQDMRPRPPQPQPPFYPPHG